MSRPPPGRGSSRCSTNGSAAPGSSRSRALGAQHRPPTTGMGFWSINPYVGCEFGCTYCYARDTHRYAGRAAADVPPRGAARVAGLRETHPGEDRHRRACSRARSIPPGSAASSLVIGTATDPYQPAERRYRLTRSMLEMLARYRGLRIEIITKSPLVTRDIDVLQALSRAARGDGERVAGHAGPPARPPARAPLAGARGPDPGAGRLSAAGVYAGLLIAPIVPASPTTGAGSAG